MMRPESFRSAGRRPFWSAISGRKAVLGFAIIRGYANVAELVDALDLGSSAARRGGSSPFIRTRLFSMLAVAQIVNGRRA